MNQTSKRKGNYYNELYIRYVTCLDCDFRYKLFNPKCFKWQRCKNDICKSKNTLFSDVKPDYYNDKIKCYGKFECVKCKHE